MAEPNVKEAKLQVKFEDIKFNKENKVKAVLACIPIVGLIFLFVEKDDQFVRYYGAQYTIAGAIGMVFAFIPLVSLAVFVLIIMGMIKANSGEKFQIPLIADYAVKLMNAV